MVKNLGNGSTEDSISQLLSLTSEKETARRAINQLLLMIAGRKHSQATENLQDKPKLRIQKCTELAMEEYAAAQSMLQDCVPDAKRMMSEVQRKLDSLSSLRSLANIVEVMP